MGFMMDYLWSGLFLVVGGLLLFYGLWRLRRWSRLKQIVLTLTALDVMSRQFRVINAKLSIQEFVNVYVISEPFTSKPFFAALDGKYQGKLFIEDLAKIDRKTWTVHSIGEVVRPLLEVETVTEQTPLLQVIRQLEDPKVSQLTVLSLAGVMVGIIDRPTLVQAIAHQLHWRVSEAVLSQIQRSQRYPRPFPLDQIAKLNNSQPNIS